MKATIVILSAIGALADPGVPSDVPINCARANANYCMGGDIIVRCDENAIGTQGRCTPNLSGYPPAGGVANCWQSSEEAGDAACEKNCVVYADPPFTLEDCNPTPTATPTHFPNSTVTTVTTLTTTFCSEGCTHPPPPPPGNVTSTPPPGNGTDVPPPPSDSTSPPPPGDGDTTTGGGEPTTPPNPPNPPPTDTEPPPSAAVITNKASIFFAIVGIVAAYFL